MERPYDCIYYNDKTGKFRFICGELNFKNKPPSCSRCRTKDNKALLYYHGEAVHCKGFYPIRDKEENEKAKRKIEQFQLLHFAPPQFRMKKTNKTMDECRSLISDEQKKKLEEQEEIIKEYEKCKNSFAYFYNNYCRREGMPEIKQEDVDWLEKACKSPLKPRSRYK